MLRIDTGSEVLQERWLTLQGYSRRRKRKVATTRRQAPDSPLPSTLSVRPATLVYSDPSNPTPQPPNPPPLSSTRKHASATPRLAPPKTTMRHLFHRANAPESRNRPETPERFLLEGLPKKGVPSRSKFSAFPMPHPGSAPGEYSGRVLRAWHVDGLGSGMGGDLVRAAWCGFVVECNGGGVDDETHSHVAALSCRDSHRRQCCGSPPPHHHRLHALMEHLSIPSPVGVEASEQVGPPSRRFSALKPRKTHAR